MKGNNSDTHLYEQMTNQESSEHFKSESSDDISTNPEVMFMHLSIDDQQKQSRD